MPEDSFRDVTHTFRGGWIKALFKGVFFGFIFFLGAFPLLFRTESRAVQGYRTLKEGQGAVVPVFQTTSILKISDG